jgi:hypothetical protein
MGWLRSVTFGEVPIQDKRSKRCMSTYHLNPVLDLTEIDLGPTPTRQLPSPVAHKSSLQVSGARVDSDFHRFVIAYHLAAVASSLMMGPSSLVTVRKDDRVHQVWNYRYNHIPHV